MYSEKRLPDYAKRKIALLRQVIKIERKRAEDAEAKLKQIKEVVG